MAVTTTSNLANVLVRQYSQDDYFAPFEQNATPFLDRVESFKNETPSGQGLYFRLWLQDSHAAGSTAEGGDLPAVGQPIAQQGSITPIELYSSFGLSERMLSAGSKGGALQAVDVITDQVNMATRNLLFEVNRQTLTGHGSGRLAAIDTTTSSLTTFVCRLPEHVLQLRSGMKIDFYDTDTAGSKQGATETIQSINFETRTVTIGSSRSLTAGWGVYRAISTSVSTYGVCTNGLRGIADNGTLNTTIFGITRTSFPDVNATVLTAGGGTQAYSEKLVRKAINRAFFVGGNSKPDEIWTNQGIVSEHLNHTTPDRVYMVNGGGSVPDYKIGTTGAPQYSHNGQTLTFMVDGVLPSREFIVISRDYFRKHILRSTSWLADGAGAEGASGPFGFQSPASSGQNYAASKVYSIGWMGNLGCRMPKGLVRVTEVADEELAGDSVDA